jgi:ribosomal protein S18 acetylase RimI-like enzyme
LAENHADRVVSRQQLSEEERQAARQLAIVCNAFEGLELKLNLDWPEPVEGDEANSFLYYEGQALVGYCGMDYGELCGMVLPDHRRKGIGSALYGAVLAECRRRGKTDLIIICEQASRSGKGFMARTGAEYTFAEHHMELDVVPDGREPPSPEKRLEVSEAGEDDIEAIALLHHGSVDEKARERVAYEMGSPGQYFLIGRLNGAPVTTLRIVDLGGKVGIYGFVVALELRGQGYGKEMLAETIRRLTADGQTRIALEVETNNTVAVGLYKALGFKTTTTYEYYSKKI